MSSTNVERPPPQPPKLLVARKEEKEKHIQSEYKHHFRAVSNKKNNRTVLYVFIRFSYLTRAFLIKSWCWTTKHIQPSKLSVPSCTLFTLYLFSVRHLDKSIFARKLGMFVSCSTVECPLSTIYFHIPVVVLWSAVL